MKSDQNATTKNLNYPNGICFVVKKSPKVHNLGFYKAYYSLPYNQVKPIKQALMEQLGWSLGTFQYKKRGDSPVRENEIPVIEAIFQGFGIDAWTGEKI